MIPALVDVRPHVEAAEVLLPPDGVFDRCLLFYFFFFCPVFSYSSNFLSLEEFYRKLNACQLAFN